MTGANRGGKYPDEMRERGVRMVFEHQDEYPSQWKAIESVAKKLGVNHESAGSVCCSRALLGRDFGHVRRVFAPDQVGWARFGQPQAYFRAQRRKQNGAHLIQLTRRRDLVGVVGAVVIVEPSVVPLGSVHATNRTP